MVRVHSGIVPRLAAADIPNARRERVSSMNDGIGGPDDIAGIDQIFEEERFGIEQFRDTGFAGVPGYHRHVTENAHDDASCPLRHGNMHGADNRTDLHDESPFQRRLKIKRRSYISPSTGF
jgi:hypothetical protein